MSFPEQESGQGTGEALQKSGGGGTAVNWVTVMQTPGITPARIYVGRLEAEGIPARAWQEGAGQALGLTVGLLGTGYVQVPEAYAEQASNLLAEEYAEEDELTWEMDEDEDETLD